MSKIIQIEELVYGRLPHVSKADWVDMLSAQGVHIDYTTFKDDYLLLEHSDYRFENGKMISSERMVYNIDYVSYDQQRNAEGIEDTIIVPMAIYDCHTDRYTILYVHYPQSDAYTPDLSHISSEADAPEIIQANPIRDIEPKEEITFDDWMKLQFQVGEIIACEEVPKSKKLLCSQVKIGSQVKQIVSGIKAHYSPEEMVGKKVVVVTNLKPVKLRGVLSQGMILCASDENGNFAVISPEKDMPSGGEVR